MEDVARRANMSRAAVYRYYPDKPSARRRRADPQRPPRPGGADAAAAGRRVVRRQVRPGRAVRAADAPRRAPAVPGRDRARDAGVVADHRCGAVPRTGDAVLAGARRPKRRRAGRCGATSMPVRPPSGSPGRSTPCRSSRPSPSTGATPRRSTASCGPTSPAASPGASRPSPRSGHAGTGQGQPREPGAKAIGRALKPLKVDETKCSRLGREPVVGEAGEELLPRDAGLETGERGAEAEVDAVAEGRWRGARRRMSKRSGSGNSRSSRLAAAHTSITRLRAGMTPPWMAMSRVAVRGGSALAGRSGGPPRRRRGSGPGRRSGRGAGRGGGRRVRARWR